jgi:hypothetical protein
MELDELEKSKFSFITFRAHVSEPQLFEDFISYFLPYISMKFPFYIYSIEKDDTPDRHIHILLQHYETEKQKLKQKIEAKWYKDFNKSIKDKQTDLKCAIKYGKGPDGEDFGFTMKIEDKMKCIGYIFKDITRRNKTSGLSQSLITACCDFYFANRRIKNATDNDWKILTTKNIHVKIEEYCKTTGQDVMSPLLQFNMVKDKHTFIQLSTKQRKMAIAELRYYNGNNNIEIRQDLCDEYIYDQQINPYGKGLEHQDNYDKIKELEEQIYILKTENEKLKQLIDKQ